MNLKIDRALPYPPTITQPFILTSINNPQPLLLLYSPPLPPQKAQQPKKKFTFKANTQPVNTIEPVHLFNPINNSWTTQQTKGKFPSRRQSPAHAILGPCLVVYGGKQLSPSKQVNDLYCLNLTTWQWKKFFTMQAPPAYPNPIAIASSQNTLVVIQKELWVFQTKDVSWQTEATDLPGGFWEKVEIQMPFAPLCACLHEEQIIIFGSDKTITAALINMVRKSISPLSIEGQAKQNYSSIKMCSATEGEGLLLNSNKFQTFTYHNQNLYLGEIVSGQVSFKQFTSVPVLKINYGITQKQELTSVEIVLPQEEDLNQDTERQVAREDPHNSSLVERQASESESSIPPPSPISTEGMTNPILDKLSPLLGRQWLKRRVLQEKGKLLQDTIKRAQKMVLALCRYGNQQDKQIHINKVCRLRQSLCKVLQSQTFIRRQMQDRPGERELLSKALKDSHLTSCFDINEK